MNERDLIWLAGYLEGEGCFHFSGRDSIRRPNASGSPCVTVCATDRDVVDRAASLMGCTASLVNTRPKNAKNKPVYRAEVFGENATRLMGLLLPLMGQRRSARIVEVLAIAAARPGTPKGERHGLAKLTNEQAAAIRNSYAENAARGQITKLAKEYGVSITSAWFVVTGKTYRESSITKRA